MREQGRVLFTCEFNVKKSVAHVACEDGEFSPARCLLLKTSCGSERRDASETL
jgi:hypothetical protein